MTVPQSANSPQNVRKWPTVANGQGQSVPRSEHMPNGCQRMSTVWVEFAMYYDV